MSANPDSDNATATTGTADRRSALRDNWQLLALGGLILGMTAFVAHFGLRYHTHTADEALPINTARYFATNFPGAIFDLNATPRGLERLNALLQLLINSVTGSTASEFKVGHVVLAFAWSLVVLPVYALARGLRLGPWPALFVALLAVLNPYLLYAATFLNATLGYLTFAILLFLMWRTTVRPGPLIDLAVLVALVFVALARVSYAPLILALPVAVLVQNWRDRPDEQGFGTWLTRLPATLWRDHAVLVIAAIGGLLFLALKGMGGFTGGYGENAVADSWMPSIAWDKFQALVARTAQNVAFLPVAFAVPWLIREAIRPGSRESGSFAVLGLTLMPLYFYVFFFGVIEDRYAVVLIPVIIVAFGCALFRSTVSWPAVAATARAIAGLVYDAGVYPLDDPFSYFIAPGAQFFKQIVLTRLASALPAGDSHVLTIALIAIVAVIIAIAFLLRGGGRRSKWATIAASVGVLAYMAIGSAYAAQKFTNEAGAPTLTFEQQTYADRVSQGEPVGLLIINPTEDVARGIRWFAAGFFNGSVSMNVGEPGLASIGCCPRNPQPTVELDIDRRTGQVRVVRGKLPPFILVPSGWLPWNLNSAPIETGPDLMHIDRVSEPPRLSFASLGGTFPDGWIKADESERLRVFPRSSDASPACLQGTIEAPATDDRKPTTVRFRRNATRAEFEVPTGESTKFKLQLPDREAVDFEISGNNVGTVGVERQVSARVGDLIVGDCSS